MKVSELLTDETKWCQGAYARDIHGQEVSYYSLKAVRYCLTGAILQCYQDIDKGNQVSEAVIGVGEAVIGVIEDDIFTWNDADERTFADIRKLIEDLDI